MSFELRLDEEAAADIERFVLDRFGATAQQLEAYHQIMGLLHEIADDPLSAGTTAPGPQVGLMAVRRLEIDGVGYHVRVAYQFSMDEAGVDVLGFKQQPL